MQLREVKALLSDFCKKKKKKKKTAGAEKHKGN